MSENSISEPQLAPAGASGSRFFERFLAAWRNPWAVIALLAIVLAGWQWLETRVRLADTEKAITRRLSDGAASNQESRNAVRQAQEQIAAQQARIAALEGKLAEFQGQTAALQSLYGDLARSRDDATLLEIEQAVTLAAQQMQLAGNVRAAVLALQTADAKLARLDRPQFYPLRKALSRDLERLRALPFVDVPGISLKLENIVSSVDAMALAVDERPRPNEKAAKTKGGAEATWWERLGNEAWQEVKGLVRIQRFDRTEPVLLAPGQGFFLRENLKLRLLNARLALFARDQWTYRNDLKSAREWLETHFDGRDKAVQAALIGLRQVSVADINIELPNLGESLSALNGVKAGGKEKK